VNNADTIAFNAILSKIDGYIAYQAEKGNAVSIHQLQHIKRGLNAIGTGHYDKIEEMRNERVSK
jgi:hypothetical protein